MDPRVKPEDDYIKTNCRTNETASAIPTCREVLTTTILFDYEYRFAEYEYNHCILIFIIIFQANVKLSTQTKERFHP